MSNTFGVIPTPQERQRKSLCWGDLFTEDELSVLALGLLSDARHYGCGGWQMDDYGPLICACGKPLFWLEAVAR